MQIDAEIAEVDRELAAIDAYERTRTGWSHTLTRAATGRRRARTGSKREAVVKVVREAPHGLTRGELLERMGVKGDKAGEMSVSNVLTALTKSNVLARNNGRYVHQQAA